MAPSSMRPPKASTFSNDILDRLYDQDEDLIKMLMHSNEITTYGFSGNTDKATVTTASEQLKMWP